MAETMEMFVGVDPYVCSEPRFRLRDFLVRKLQGQFPVKRLAQQINCTTKTAENILAGHWPNSRHMQRIVQTFGRDALDAMFEPDINSALARAKEAERQAEAAYELAKTRRRTIEGRVASPPRSVVQDADARALGENVTVLSPDRGGRR